MELELPGNSGDILVFDSGKSEYTEPEKAIEPLTAAPVIAEQAEKEEPGVQKAAGASENTLDQVILPAEKPYEEMTVEELQKAIYEKMKKNGPVTDRMYRDITENTHKGSLLNWVKSFH